MSQTYFTADWHFSHPNIARYCPQLLELWKYIGPDTDVPAGDVGVGGREIGYMYGMYKKAKQRLAELKK